MKNLLLSRCLIILASLLLLQGCANNTNLEFSRNEDFNLDWKFAFSDIEGAEEVIFDDSDWMVTDLPHDWSTIPFETQDSLHTGPFSKNLAGGKDVGYLRDGIAWYRKSFKLAKLKEGQQVILHFDGVQSMMQLYVNGQCAGDHTYGYTPFYFNITSFLNHKGAENTLAIRTVNPGENSRWFAGAGIYRPVRLSIVNEVAVDVWGVGVNTRELHEKAALIDLDIQLSSYAVEESQLSCIIQIRDPKGMVCTSLEANTVIPAQGKQSLNLEVEIKDPVPWDIDDPSLYSVIVELWRDGTMLDSYPLNFGIRTIAFAAETGFLLNGKEVELKGACMHHDNGLLGAAVYPAAEERRVRIMKENGFNAIRTSHNPPSEAFLDACDILGMLVIDEAFDAWLKPKRKNDYSVHFPSSWEGDLLAMLRRDRHHPSIIMWSFGNEIQERADSLGLEISKKMIKTIQSVDVNRPVTEAICDFWDNPGKTWDYAQNAFELLDVSGYNYQWGKYESDHEAYPSRVMYGSESVPGEAWENWDLVKKHSYVIGDFVWTGMDYIGESAIGHARLVDESEKVRWGYSEWPWYLSWCGDIDIIGSKKPQSYYRDIVWGERKLELLVHSPIPKGKKEYVSWWGWPDELRSWTWPGAEGKLLEVNVYSSYPEVILKKDGEVIGRKHLAEKDKYTAHFSVAYTPGTLEAVGIEDGEVKERIQLLTCGETRMLRLTPEATKLKVGKDQIAYIRVDALDSEGRIVPNDESLLDIEISGAGTLLAAGNGSPFINGSFSDSQFQLFRGQGLIIVRSTGEPGDIEISIGNDQLGKTDCAIKTIL